MHYTILLGIWGLLALAIWKGASIFVQRRQRAGIVIFNAHSRQMLTCVRTSPREGVGLSGCA